jgi:hypothetical protein
MSSFTEEIQQLQLRILELEKQQKKKDESDKKTSIDHNFTVINDVLVEKKNAIKMNKYSKSVPLARYHDQEVVTHLESIYNILYFVDERLKKLEDVDERLNKVEDVDKRLKKVEDRIGPEGSPYARF